MWKGEMTAMGKTIEKKILPEYFKEVKACTDPVICNQLMHEAEDLLMSTGVIVPVDGGFASYWGV